MRWELCTFLYFCAIVVSEYTVCLCACFFSLQRSMEIFVFAGNSTRLGTCRHLSNRIGNRSHPISYLMTWLMSMSTLNAITVSPRRLTRIEICPMNVSPDLWYVWLHWLQFYYFYHFRCVQRTCRFKPSQIDFYWSAVSCIEDISVQFYFFCG